MKYLFNALDKVRNELSGRCLNLFLDFDGTLAPIVNKPDKARMPCKIKASLDKLSKKLGPRIAIVSGRAIRDIKNRVGLKGIVYVGNHGLEIEGPRLHFCASIFPEYKAALERIKEELSRKISAVKGAFIEDKGLSLSLHFRQASESNRALAKAIFHEVVIMDKIKGIIKTKSGKMVLEIRPPADTDKGRVVMWLLARQQFAYQGKQVLPIYIGDDLTDEDAFKALKNKGITVFVGESKDSYAGYYLKNVNEVAEFLKVILNAQ